MPLPSCNSRDDASDSLGVVPELSNSTAPRPVAAPPLRPRPCLRVARAGCVPPRPARDKA